MKSAKIIYGISKSLDDAKDVLTKLPKNILENRHKLTIAGIKINDNVLHLATLIINRLPI